MLKFPTTIRLLLMCFFKLLAVVLSIFADCWPGVYIFRSVSSSWCTFTLVINNRYSLSHITFLHLRPMPSDINKANLLFLREMFVEGLSSVLNIESILITMQIFFAGRIMLDSIVKLIFILLNGTFRLLALRLLLWNSMPFM